MRDVGGSKQLGEMRDALRRKHYSIRTEHAYIDWAKRYILFHRKRRPNKMEDCARKLKQPAESGAHGRGCGK